MLLAKRWRWIEKVSPMAVLYAVGLLTANLTPWLHDERLLDLNNTISSVCIPLAIPLVLPGISFSYMLMVFAIYTRFLAALSSLDIMFLLPLCLGLLIGMVAFTKLLDKAMSQKPGPTYYCITGFVLGSIIMLAKELPHWPAGWEIPACVVTFIVGAVGVYLYSRKAE